MKNADFVFDCVKYLTKDEIMPCVAKYGGHPESEGCKVWGEALFDAVADLINK